MNQEELKTCLGQLLLDLRVNWAFDYSERLNYAKELCVQINDDTSEVENAIEGEFEGDWNGRVFRDCTFYGYSSKEGITENSKEWLKNNLSHPEYCDALEEITA